MSVENEENVVNMDDLVKRLREVESNHSGWGYAAIAADRIEQLVATCEELEAKLAAADAMIEAQQKDYASNNVRFAEAEHRAKVAKAALPAVYRLALADAGLTCEQLAEVELTVRNPPYVEGYSDAASICFENICSLPTPTAAELMARIHTGEKE